MDLTKIEPFEICSIRPPTENFSLTFRLTRNCGWNRCMFCPVYKEGVKFSRRSIEEVKQDIDRAKMLDDLLTRHASGIPSPGDSDYREAERLIEEIRAAQAKAGKKEPARRKRGSKTEKNGGAARPGEEDKRSSWFSSWFKDEPTLEDSIYHLLAWRMNVAQTCFLGDSDALFLSSDFFAEAVHHIKNRFPTLDRFSVYGRTQSAAKKTQEELKAFREAGLDRIHFGIESGNDMVLKFMKKGATGEEHVIACRKTREAGISPSVYIMPGLGGAQWSTEHAVDTARVLTEARADYVRLRSLEIFPGTGLADAAAKGEFTEASEEQVAREIRILVENIKTNTVVVSDSASNLLDVSGRLPEDRAKMLKVIDEYLALSPKGKLAFSLSSRLRSFIGQYGGLTQDIVSAIKPYVQGSQVNVSRASEEEIRTIIRLIRSKLMP
jgi:radical SAM superfamily enzyme YgiQ (UPF0313 family)